jgi:NDP-sugar pyrophosphorylase family protein
LKKIVKDADSYFDKIIISSNGGNQKIFQKIFQSNSKVRIIEDKYLTGPLGPICREILEIRQRVYGCAGDFYLDFSWKEFENFHLIKNKPISILIAPSLSMPDGALLELDQNNVVISWRRLNRTRDFDLINIGAYIIDPLPEVIDIISKFKVHKEDYFFNMFIPKQLVAAYNPGTIGFNINTQETYEKMCKFLMENY